MRRAVRLRRGEKRKGGEVMEWVNIDASSHQWCCKREQRMMYLEGYGESTESCLQDETLLGQSVQ